MSRRRRGVFPSHSPSTLVCSASMGIHDREYLRDDSPPALFSNRPVVVQIVFVNIGFFLADMLVGGQSHWVTEGMAVHHDTLRAPWQWYRFLTYGFAHSYENIQHILFNMFLLWMFGRPVEMIYGRKEFLCFYLTAILLGGIFWAARFEALGGENFATMLGASGGVVAVFMLFVFHYPKQTILLFLVIPVPAWVAGLLVVGSDIALAFRPNSMIAFDVHLVGAAFAACYFYGQWRIRPLLSIFRGRRPKLRVHSSEEPPYRDSYGSPFESQYQEPSRVPPREPQGPTRSERRAAARAAKEQGLDAEADRILEKLHREGQDSLTRKERRILEDYSRRMRQRRD